MQICMLLVFFINFYSVVGAGEEDALCSQQTDVKGPVRHVSFEYMIGDVKVVHTKGGGTTLSSDRRLSATDMSSLLGALVQSHDSRLSGVGVVSSSSERNYGTGSMPTYGTLCGAEEDKDVAKKRCWLFRWFCCCCCD